MKDGPLEVCRSSLIAMHHREKKNGFSFKCVFGPVPPPHPPAPPDSPLPPLLPTRTTRTTYVPLAHVFWIKESLPTFPPHRHAGVNHGLTLFIISDIWSKSPSLCRLSGQWENAAAFGDKQEEKDEFNSCGWQTPHPDLHLYHNTGCTGTSIQSQMPPNATPSPVMAAR